MLGPRIWEYEESGKRYHAVERGTLVDLLDVSVRETSSPFNPWESVLVEPCAGPAKSPSGGLPCWPQARGERTQEVLRAAQYLNRDLGTFRIAWIIGTNPLVITFLDGPPDHAPPEIRERINRLVSRRKTLPTTRPGFVEMVGRSGELASQDFRMRNAQFVTSGDLEETADTVLVYPQDMPLINAGEPAPPGMAKRVKVITLAKPKPLQEIMNALTQSKQLERDAAKAIEVPVLTNPPATAPAATAPEVDSGEDLASVAARIFRTEATLYAERNRIYATEPDALSDMDRTDLLRLIDEYQRQVDATADQIRIPQPDAAAVLERAHWMQVRFVKETLAPWMDSHASAKSAIDRQDTILHCIADDVLDGGQKVLAAAQRAGLADDAGAKARKAADRASANWLALADRIQGIGREAARAPEGDPRRLAADAVPDEIEIGKLRIASKLRQELRALLPPERVKQFDDQLAKL